MHFLLHLPPQINEQGKFILQTARATNGNNADALCTYRDMTIDWLKRYAFNLAGKAALVTGSSRGFCLAIVEALLSEGLSVALISRNHEDLANVVVRLPGSIAVAGDVAESTEAQSVVAEVHKYFGKPDIMVCIVGSGKSVTTFDETPEEW